MAFDVCDAVLEHTVRLVRSLGADALTPTEDSVRLASTGPLGLAVQRLVSYAQTGSIDPTLSAEDALKQVCFVLFANVTADPPDVSNGLPVGVSADTAIGVALIGAYARLKLGRDEGLSTRELAALSSLSIRQIQQLIAGAKLAATGSNVSAKEARRWLGARGISV